MNKTRTHSLKCCLTKKTYSTSQHLFLQVYFNLQFNINKNSFLINSFCALGWKAIILNASHYPSYSLFPQPVYLVNGE